VCAASPAFRVNQGHEQSRAYTQDLSWTAADKPSVPSREAAKFLGLLLAIFSQFYEIPHHKTSTAFLNWKFRTWIHYSQ
jgi:hypothetical protein